MNKPIGIPSGWEERAARAACGAGFAFLASRPVYAWNIIPSRTIAEFNIKRDYTVEPDQYGIGDY